GVMTGIGAITSDGAISTTSTLNADGATTLAALTLDANSDLTLASGTGSFILTNSVSNASDQVVDLNPAFAGGATDTLVYTVIDVAAFTPTNAAGTDTINGLAIGALTQGVDAARLTAAAINIGDGWDTGLTGATYTIDGTTALTIGAGGGTIALNSSDWDISATGDLTGIGAITNNGLITGTLGLTITGAAVALNVSSNFDVNVATGTSTGDITLGGGTAGQLISINSDDWDISTAGVMTGIGAITSDGAISTTSTLTAGSGVEIITLATGKIDADALTLTVAADAGTGTSSGSGFIARSDGIGLLQGCGDQQLLKFIEATDTWDCGSDNNSGGATALDALLAATTDDTAITSGDSTIIWQWALTTAGSKALTIGETTAGINGVGDQHLLTLTTLSTSTAGPLEITSNSADGGDIEFNLASAGDFEIQDAGAAFVTFSDAGLTTFVNDVDITMGAAENLQIDAAATDTTTTSGVIGLVVDAGNAAVDGINIDLEAAGVITAATDITALEILMTATDT
ncbi:MAG: hypothetical protein AAB499_01070, partial [Patescibacteria group bacterium]